MRTPGLAEHSLPASSAVSALTRQVQAAGGFATVLRRGTQWGGALLLVHRRQGFVGAYEKVPSLSGAPDWRLAAEGESEVAGFVERQARFDPDLWVLELDIADLARFVPGIATTR
jgi:hypothetical protein